MPHRVRWIVPFALTFGLTLLNLAAASPATLCSMRPLPAIRNASMTHFVGEALKDTVFAGPGLVMPRMDLGQWTQAEANRVYAQLVRIDSLGGFGETALEVTFSRRGSRDVAVVPWEYGPSCEPRIWTKSVRWIEPGLVGFYAVRLRPDSLWIDGRPTFDALAANLQPYPHAPFLRRGYRGTRALAERPSLDAHEMFGLHEALPVYVGRSIDSASVDNILRWEAANPELARKYPADVMLEEVRRSKR